MQQRATGGARVHSAAMVVVIACSLFTDFFLYGILFPLAAHSPVTVQDEGRSALLFGAFAISVLLVSPLFG